MTQSIPQSTTIRVPLKLFLSSDHITAATGKTVAVVISKNGGAFANPNAGATNATEIASGWYYVDLDTTDTGTLGPLIVRGTSASCDDTEHHPFKVVKATNGGWTALPDAAAEAAGGLYTRGTGAGQINQDANGRIDANVKTWIGGAIPAVNVTGVPIVDDKYLLGTIYSTPATAGIQDVNVKNMNNVAATAITTIKAVQGLTTADTITTVTNLTNAPTVGDFTAAMKTSVQTAADAAVTANSLVNAIAGYIDTEVAAIKTQTDKLTFTVANEVNANMRYISGTAASADNLKRSTIGIVLGTVGAASTTTSIVTSALDPAAAVADQFKGKIITFDRSTTTTNLRGQSTDITASGNTGVLTVTALTDAPVSGDTFVIT